LERFDNKRLVIRKHFKNLPEIQPIENPSELRDLLNKTDSAVLGIKAMGETIEDTFSKFLCYLVTTKIDENTRRDWENSLSSATEHPSHRTLFKFLRNRSYAEEAYSPNPTNESKTPPKKSPAANRLTIANLLTTINPSKRRYLSILPASRLPLTRAPTFIY